MSNHGRDQGWPVVFYVSVCSSRVGGKSGGTSSRSRKCHTGRLQVVRLPLGSRSGSSLRPDSGLLLRLEHLATPSLHELRLCHVGAAPHRQSATLGVREDSTNAGRVPLGRPRTSRRRRRRVASWRRPTSSRTARGAVAAARRRRRQLLHPR